MIKKLNPLLPKKGGLGVLALFGILFITLIFAFYFWPSNELVAKPTVAQQINTAITQQLASTETSHNSTPQHVTGVVSLDEPRPKIDPKLVEELKELKHQKKHKSVTVLVDVKDDEALQKLQQIVSEAHGTITRSFNIGKIAVVEIPSDYVEQVAGAAGVEQVSSEKEYVAFMADRIPAFSIDTAAWANNITGKGIRIAILDTGVGPHDKITVTEGTSFVADENASDQNGHGTHVAGIAQGVAKNAVIYNAKVLNKAGAGTTSQIIAGINWAVENNADIISMSFGGMFTELDGPLASSVKDAINHGVVFVVAAGNCKTGCGGFYGVTTPGNVKEVITAGAVDDNNVVAPFSSGDTFDGYIKPDVAAPGISITSTWLNNGEKTLSGTSMSTPFVAGIAALLLEKEPGLTNEQVKQKLESTADDKGTPGKDTSYGSGVVDVLGLLSNVSVTDNSSSNITTVQESDDVLGEVSILSNYTVIETDGKNAKVVYLAESGENITLQYHTISQALNDTELHEQMVMSYYVDPSTYYDAITEFLPDIPFSGEPYYIKFKRKNAAGTPSYSKTDYYILPSSVMTDLYAGEYVAVLISFKTPATYGTYSATAEIVDPDTFSLSPSIKDALDPSGKTFEVVDVVGPVTCSVDSDCGSNKWLGSPFCSGGDVWQSYKDWGCFSPGTPTSYCYPDVYDKKKTDCGAGSCSGGSCTSSPACVDADGDGEGLASPCAFFSDCDDSNPFVHHGAEEICDDGIDENCFGGADEGCLGKPCTTNSQCKSNVCYSGACIPPCPDGDSDGYGSGFNPVCTNPGIDCNDAVATINPGAAEWCSDSVDNNCNGLINENCPCAKNSNCATGMSCTFTGTAGSCQPATCENECPVAGVSTCSGTAIYTCANTDSDACLENTYTTNCGSGTICEDGKNTCQPKPNVQLQLEETQLPIYAQAGDKITAYLTASGTQSAQLVFPTAAFTLDTSSCSGTFTFSGTRECAFTVKETAPPKAHWIGIKYGPSRKVTVITKPNVLIVTHKPMLYERFGSASAVTKLLKQTYDFAYTKRGVVYDLADYNLPPNPFEGKPYTEAYDRQDMKDNTFAIEAGAFIKDKCHGCTSTLILGDDFVVPHYRRELDKSFFFGLSTETDEIYSDISYVGRTNLQFSEFEEIFYQKEKFNGKKIMLILPDEVTPAQRTQIDRLKNFIEDDNGPINGEVIDELKASDAPCNSHLAFTYYDGYTLVIIGTSQKNKALQCFPFVIENDLESVTIERNPWDGRAYAVVVNSDNADQISVLNDLLESGEYKKLHSSGWLVARTTANVALGASVGLLILSTGGTATPVLIMAAEGVNIAVNTLDGAECLEFGGGECAEFAIGLLLPIGIEKIGKPVVKSMIDIVGPRLRYFFEELGEDGFTAFFKRIGKKGMLNPGSGFDKLMRFIGDNDRVGNTVVKELDEYLARSGDDFAEFLSKVAETSPERAAGILKMAHAAKLDSGQLSKIISENGMPANLLVKSIDDLAGGFKVFADEALTYSNGKLKPAFRGLSDIGKVKISAALSTGKIDDVVNAIEQSFEHDVAGKTGGDFVRQIAEGGFSDQATVSLTYDFGIASRYATETSNPGIVLVFDKRMASVVDSQETLKALDAAIPNSKVNLLNGRALDVGGTYLDALANNEATIMGKPRIEWVVGWYEMRKGANGLVSKKFVFNPKYAGKQAEWLHTKTIEQIKQLHVDNDVANYDKIIAWMQKNGESIDDVSFDINEGNTAFWPKEVN